MHHALRRSAVILASSAVVLSGAPLLDSAFADTALTQSSVTPSNAQTVKDSHPTISATYTDNGVAANLDPSSTIAVSKSGTSIGCTGVVSGNAISCNYSGLLKSGTYSIVIHAVEAANTAKTADNTTPFTVDVPVIQSASPAANSTVAALPNGVVQVTYNQKIDDQHSTITVKQVSDLNGNPAGGTPLTGQTTFSPHTQVQPPVDMTDSNDGTSIIFEPDSQPAAGGTYQVDLDVFGVTGASKPFVYNPKAETKDTYTFVIDNTPPTAPTNLSAPTITQANVASVPFSGHGRPGNTITVSVTDGTHTADNTGANSGGPVTVPTCATAPDCTWTVNLTNLVSKTVADGTLSWTATAHNATNTPTSSSVAHVLKDTTPPTNPSVSPTLPAGSTTLHVTGTDNDASLDHYTVDVTDKDSKHIGPFSLTRASGGGVTGNGDYVTDIDVSSLDDGQLSIVVTPFDQYGNKPSTTPPANTSATKAVGLVQYFNTSTFTVNSDVVTFPQVQALPNQAIEKPTQIVLDFANPITTTRPDTGTYNNTPTTNAKNGNINANAPYLVEVLPNGQLGNAFTATGVIDTAHNSHQYVLTPPAGLHDGRYELYANVYLASCANFNSDPLGTTAPTPCATYDQIVTLPNSASPFIFTIDTTGPAAPTITTIPAGTIDGSNVGDVVINVEGEPGATVTLTAKSNGGGAVLALNQGQPITIGSNGKAQDEEDNAALAVLPDGTLTISGTPTDAAGNVGTVGTGTVTLAARPSIPRSLAVSQSSSSFTLHWVAPSYDGYTVLPGGNPISHLTGYRYTYQDTTAGAVDGSVHTVSVDNPSATSATQGGLLAGHSYAVTLCALNNVSGPCNAVSTTALPAYFTALTAKISKGLVVYGNPITLSGSLTRTDIGAGIANQPLKVTPHYDNGTTGTVIHISTNSLGNWSLGIAKPAKNALYVVTFNDTHADPTYQPSSSSVRSLVAVSLRIDKVSFASSSHTSPVTISGHITPNQSGRYVNIYAKAAGATRYQRIGSAKISSKSTWVFTKTFGAGKFYLYSSFPSQNGNVGGSSQGVTFTRS